MITTTALSRDQLRELSAELRSERARAERALGVGPSGGASGTGSAGSADVATRTIAEERYDLILEALNRLDDGSYGVCAGCAQPIPYGRLLVMPETKHCLTCGARA